VDAVRIVESPVHHGDHSGLLKQCRTHAATDATVDAIIVPSARTAPYLVEAAGLAEQLNCTLVVLCSRHARQRDVVAYLEDEVFVLDLVAVDLPDARTVRFPQLRTSKMLAETLFERRTDTSAKRNVGLALARMVGWAKVMYLDDDITLLDPNELHRAAAELDDHDAVGLSIGGYPDNSVVCHAYRATGGRQATFLGGGALAVPVERTASFFPEIYNEDWFFLLGDERLRPATMIGTAAQIPYDPFGDPDRARREEFGDVLAEGIFALLDRCRKIQDADEIYWDAFLSHRGSMIDDIIARVPDCEMEPEQRYRMLSALKAARGRLCRITSRLCVEYVEAWQEDRITWWRYFEGLPRDLPVEKALSYLRLRGRFTVRWNRTGLRPREPRLIEARRRLGRAAKEVRRQGGRPE